MSKSNLIVCFPFIDQKEGFEYLAELNIPFLNINYGYFRFYERGYTEKEKKDCDASMRIGYEGLMKHIKDVPSMKEVNRNFEKDVTRFLNDTLMSEKYEFIFIEFDPEIIRYLTDNQIKFSVVYPLEHLKFYYVGKEYCKTVSKPAPFSHYPSRLICDMWDDFIKKYDSINDGTAYRLKEGENLVSFLKFWLGFEGRDNYQPNKTYEAEFGMLKNIYRMLSSGSLDLSRDPVHFIPCSHNYLKNNGRIYITEDAMITMINAYHIKQTPPFSDKDIINTLSYFSLLDRPKHTKYRIVNGTKMYVIYESALKTTLFQ